MGVQAEEHLELQDAQREAWSRPSLRAFRRNYTRCHLDLGLLTSRKARPQIAFLKPLCLWYFVMAAPGN